MNPRPPINRDRVSHGDERIGQLARLDRSHAHTDVNVPFRQVGVEIHHGRFVVSAAGAIAPSRAGYGLPLMSTSAGSSSRVRYVAVPQHVCLRDTTR